MEDIHRFHLLAGRNELDRLAGDIFDGKGSTTPGVAVHLRQYDSVEIETFVEDLGGLDCVLSGHRIDYEQ